MSSIRKKHHILLAVQLCTILYAGGDFSVIEPYEGMPLQEETYLADEEFNKFFVSASIGYSSIDVKSRLENGENFNDNALDSGGLNIDVEGGYRINYHIFATLGYQGTFLDMATLHNFYSSINYQFSEYELDPYVGLVAGQSILNWSDDPHYVLIDRDLSSTSLYYGAQVGFSKEIKENWKMTAKYQLLNYNHELDIRNGLSNIQHTLTNNFLIGAKYEF